MVTTSTPRRRASPTTVLRALTATALLAAVTLAVPGLDRLRSGDDLQTGTPPSRAAVATSARSTRNLVHRLFVVEVAGRRLHRVSPSSAARNEALYGVPTPAQVIRRFRPGGVILFADNVATRRQVSRFTSGLQDVARRLGYQLLVMTDQEGGRVRRLPGAVLRSQPSAASYGGRGAPARRDARAVGTRMRRMGVLVNLAPVADVATVGDRGVIGDRSFGSTADVVSRLVTEQVCGYHRGGVATTIKHWPGHGSTAVDSHERLPELTVPLRRWRRVHLPPFRAGIASGADLVMVGHLAYPRLDPSGRPATVSPVLTRTWLRDKLGFAGPVITDALTMDALADYGSSARLATRAFGAGADLLLMPSRPRSAARGLLRAVRHGWFTRASVIAAVDRAEEVQDRAGLLPGPAELAGC
jgi:beta-N-acetylhexosaminidase